MKQNHELDLKPYLDLKNGGATPQEVYIKALDRGYKRHECLLLIAGVFDLPLHEAREIGHQVYRENLNMPKD